MRLLISLLLSLAACTCTAPGADPDDDGTALATRTARRTFDEDRARERAADDLTGETFESVGSVYSCTEDCSGHEAGFEWARNHEITDASECGGQSQSFAEGCQAYGEAIEERVEAARTEHDDGDDDGAEDYSAIG